MRSLILDKLYWLKLLRKPFLIRVLFRNKRKKKTKAKIACCFDLRGLLLQRKFEHVIHRNMLFLCLRNLLFYNRLSSVNIALIKNNKK